MTLFLVLAIAAAFLFAWIPAAIAMRKGRSFAGYYIFGLFLFLPALVVALAISPSTVRVGEIVKVIRAVTLSDGSTVPAGWASKALDVDVIDGTPTVMITGPSGATHWIAKSNARPA